MPTHGHYRSYSLSQKSIHLGRCVKHQFLRRLSNTFFLSPTLPNASLNRNTSALSEQPVFRANLMLPTFNRIPPAPPLPSNFNHQSSQEIIKSTEFSKAIKSHPNSRTPSGTDLTQSMIIRPSQMTDPVPIKSTLRNRRRTPLTPDVLALTKVRRPEHIKSNIAQRIEELKQASLLHSHLSDEKPLKNEKSSKIVVATCEYKTSETERQWLKEQTQFKSPIQFLNTTNYLQLNNRLFHLQSIEFLDEKTVRFYAQEDLLKHFKPITIITILILSILRLIENTLSNLSIPGIQIILNLIYVFILIIIAIIFLTNQK